MSTAVVERLRALGAHPRLEPAVALLLRARTVRESAGFLVRELRRRPAVARYTIRSSGLTVVVRHGTGDVVTLGEVFHRPDYAPPPEVDAVLAAAPRTLDLGANVGMFGLDLMARRPDARIDAYEPDPGNVAILRRVVAANGFEDRWSVHEAAAGAEDGTVRFAAGRAALSRIDERGELQVRQVDICGGLSQVDLLKMDIEGGEWSIIADPRFGVDGPKVTVLEYHPHLCPWPDPRQALRNRLEALGYAHHWLVHRPDGTGMAWAWRRP